MNELGTGEKLDGVPKIRGQTAGMNSAHQNQKNNVHIYTRPQTFSYQVL
jgi:hypothetical protein